MTPSPPGHARVTLRMVQLASKRRSAAHLRSAWNYLADCARPSEFQPSPCRMYRVSSRARPGNPAAILVVSIFRLTLTTAVNATPFVRPVGNAAMANATAEVKKYAVVLASLRSRTRKIVGNAGVNVPTMKRAFQVFAQRAFPGTVSPPVQWAVRQARGAACPPEERVPVVELFRREVPADPRALGVPVQ